MIVGVNAFQKEDNRDDLELLRITDEMGREQARSVQAIRAKRDGEAVHKTLARLEAACRDPKDNVMPHLIDCVNAYCTEGEIVDAMVQVYGRYTERSVF